MDYISALSLIHNVTKPQRYVEIGCRRGVSLALARCPALAIDPDFEIDQTLCAPTKIFRTTSDDFFKAHDLEDELGGAFDIAFIDGMHLAEFALRDFINLEKYSHPNSIILIDDILPSTPEMATRKRNGTAWTGDVYKIISILQKNRPDLAIEIFDIEMKGLALIRNLNRHSTILSRLLPELVFTLEREDEAFPNIQKIRNLFNPRPVNELSSFLNFQITPFLEQKIKLESDCRIVSDANRYFKLIKGSLLGDIYLDNELRIFYLMECLNGKDKFDYDILHDIRNKRNQDYEELKVAKHEGYLFRRKIQNAGFSHTMAGRKRLDMLQKSLDRIRKQEIPGDFFECGVWRGGSSIFAKAYFDVWDMERKVWVADSFEGLPQPTLEQDAKMDLSAKIFPQLAVTLDEVRHNFNSYSHLDENVVFLKGWFKDTLHKANIQKISILRLDGDLYESTMDALSALYDKLVPGGEIIVDDFYAIPQCKDAVSDYFAKMGYQEPDWVQVDWTCVHGIKPL
jgi:predicted O-methyltransferase YrrM